VEPLVKEIYSQEIRDEKDEKCLPKGGGDEVEEFMPPPRADVHPFVGKQGETYIHESGPVKNGEILRHFFYNIKVEDQTRGSLFFIGFARAWCRKKKK
jgi:hypothetical protein